MDSLHEKHAGVNFLDTTVIMEIGQKESKVLASKRSLYSVTYAQ